MTRKKLTYTLIGEGFAEYKFIPAYIEWAVSQQFSNCQVVRTNIQIPISRQSSVSKVLQDAARFCEQSFADTRNPCDLFIAGIDLDKSDFGELEIHAARLHELKTSMRETHKLYADKIILFVPIQAIDYWLCYVEEQATVDSLEAKAKDEIKKKVYGSKNPDRRQIEKIAKTIAEKADFAKLAKQSRSFKHFHQQVIAFLDTQESK